MTLRNHGGRFRTWLWLLITGLGTNITWKRCLGSRCMTARTTWKYCILKNILVGQTISRNRVMECCLLVTVRQRFYYRIIYFQSKLLEAKGFGGLGIVNRNMTEKSKRDSSVLCGKWPLVLDPSQSDMEVTFGIWARFDGFHGGWEREFSKTNLWFEQWAFRALQLRAWEQKNVRSYWSETLLLLMIFVVMVGVSA